MYGKTALLAAFGTAMLCASLSAQMNASARGSQAGSVQSGSSASVSSMQNVQATLSKSINVKNAKVGDEVFARTTADFMANGMKVPRGSRLVGQVTEAQARSKSNAESKLGMLFDRVEPRGGGQSLPVAFHIAGIGAPANSAAMSGSEDADMNATVTTPQANAGMNANARSSGGGGLLGGVGNTVGGAARGVGSATGTVADTAGSALRTAGNVARSTVATAGSTINGIAISGTGTAGAILTSTTRDVQLQGGTSLALSGSASAQ